LPTLWEDGIAKVLKGFTTLEEVEAVCPVVAKAENTGGKSE